MIFVTVGSQLPFDRLIRTVDAWAEGQQDMEIVAQIGATDYRPSNMTFYERLNPKQFEQFFKAASCIVAHAGMGTIISSLEFGKPLLVMPRRADKGEHRNDHQLMTVKQLHKYRNVNIAYSEEEFEGKLNDTLKQLRHMEEFIEDIGVSKELITKLKSFIADDF